jgi:hypothetical protein
MPSNGDTSMRRMLAAASAALAIAGGAAMTGEVQAQPYGYYTPYGGYAYSYSPPRAYGYDGRYTPYSYYNGYDGYNGGYSSSAGLAGALLGSMMGGGYYGRDVPYDRYGPDPNGMIAPDGHRIKCKLRSGYDSDYGGYRTRRECW